MNVGDDVQVKVLGFNRRKRRIDLSMKALTEKPEAEAMPAPSRGRDGGRDGGRSGGRDGGRDGGRRRSNRDRQEPEVYEYVDDETEEVPTAMEIAMRRALGSDAIVAAQGEGQGRRGKKAHREDQRRLQEELLKRTLTMQSDN